MTELNKRERRAILAVFLIHFDLGLLFAVDLFIMPFLPFMPLWPILAIILYGFSILIFVCGIIIDFTIWHKGLESILKKKEVKQ